MSFTCIINNHFYSSIGCYICSLDISSPLFWGQTEHLSNSFVKESRLAKNRMCIQDYQERINKNNNNKQKTSVDSKCFLLLLELVFFRNALWEIKELKWFDDSIIYDVIWISYKEIIILIDFWFDDSIIYDVIWISYKEIIILIDF